MSADACPRCLKPRAICVCDRLVTLASRVEVLILQHPQEQDLALGSARLAALSLARATLQVGLSWRSLGHALGREVDAGRWAALYPGAVKRALTPEERAAPVLVLGKREAPLAPARVQGLVVLDGTWSQTKTLWWRNPWLLKLGRVVLNPREPSIYGKLRQEPRREYLSTIESIAEALPAFGEPEETRLQLRRIFRTMVQRAREARAAEKQ